MGFHDSACHLKRTRVRQYGYASNYATETWENTIKKMHISALRLTLAAAVLAGSAMTAAAYDRHVTIHNDTGMTLTVLFDQLGGVPVGQ